MLAFDVDGTWTQAGCRAVLPLLAAAEVNRGCCLRLVCGSTVTGEFTDPGSVGFHVARNFAVGCRGGRDVRARKTSADAEQPVAPPFTSARSPLVVLQESPRSSPNTKKRLGLNGGHPAGAPATTSTSISFSTRQHTTVTAPSSFSFVPAVLGSGRGGRAQSLQGSCPVRFS